jgi:vacuolar protein-sorting-associated protein 4
MSSLDSKLFSFAMKEAKEAVEFDKRGEYQKAINKYSRAAEILIQFAKFNKNPSLQKLCGEKIHEYVYRAKMLKSTLRPHQKGRISSYKKVSKKGSDIDDSVEMEEEALTKEQQELRETIAGTIITELPDIRWEDIAGLEECKQSLREAIVLPIMRPELFTGARRPWSGILLYGPPGCGKTLLAQAAATECEATFFSASAAELLSKWLGESEKLINSLFKLARIEAPSIIFFDEIDSITTSRGYGSESGGERRIKTQLLGEIQGLRSRSEKLLLILGATNRPWDIDTAMLRRFEKKIYVPIPDLEARKAIFKIHTAGVNLALTDNDYAELAEMTQGYSGSDIANVCREVIMLPIRELDKGGKITAEAEEIVVRDVTLEDFIKTLKKVKPIISEKEIQKYHEWFKQFGE